MPEVSELYLPLGTLLHLENAQHQTPNEGTESACAGIGRLQTLPQRREP
jgi:hypothetical protein